MSDEVQMAATLLYDELEEMKQMMMETAAAEATIIPSFQPKRVKMDVSIDDDDNDDHLVFKHFVLRHMACKDMATNVRAQHNAKLAAYKILETEYRKRVKLDSPIDRRAPLHYRDYDEDFYVVNDDSVCRHHLIRDVHVMVSVAQDMYRTSRVHRLNFYIFAPYLKQLRHIIDLFKNDYCCKQTVLATVAALDQLLSNARRMLDGAVKRIELCAQAMAAFTERPVFECGVCKDAFHDERHLKPDECCGYRVCQTCHVNLWKHSRGLSNPVCPVCRTSYKIINKNYD